MLWSSHAPPQQADHRDEALWAAVSGVKNEAVSLRIALLHSKRGESIFWICNPGGIFLKM